MLSRVLIIALAGVIVNSTVEAAPKLEGDVPLLINKLLKEGRPRKYGNPVGISLGVSSAAITRVLDVAAADTTDGMIRSIDLVLADDEKPIAIIFRRGRKGENDSDSEVFRMSPEGEFESAAASFGKIKAGKGVPGSLKITPLDVSDKAVEARLKKEIDFWLRGKGRKKEQQQKDNSRQLIPG